MKVVCESCEAVYAIEDGLIPPRGARGQCPRCGHQQRVMPGTTPGGDLPTAPVQPPLWEPPVPPSKPTAPAPPLMTPARGTAAAPRAPPAIAPVSLESVRPAAPAPAPAEDVCEQCGTTLIDPFDRALGICENCRQKQEKTVLAPAPTAPPGKAAPSGPKPLAGPAPTTGPSMPGPKPLAGPAPTTGPSMSGPRALGAPGKGPAPSGPRPIAAPESAAPAPTPGLAPDKLDELFEAAVADNNAKATSASPSAVARPADVPAPPANPIDQLFEEVVTGRPAAPAPAPQAVDFSAAATEKEPSVVVSDEASGVPRPAPSGPRPSSPGTSGPRPAVQPLKTAAVSAARPTPRRPWVVPLAIFIALASIGGAAWAQRWRLNAWMRPAPKGPAPLPDAVQAVVPRWRLAFVDLNGTAADYLAQGRAKLAQDNVAAYADAEELFQKALAVDPDSDEAIAGYVTALSLGRGTQVDDLTYREAYGLIEAAETRSRGRADVLVAKANLLLTRDARELNDQARALAQQALAKAKPDVKVQAQLAVGLSYVSTSARLALQTLDEALKAEPPPKRALYYRGLAHEAGGEYRAAIKDYEARLAKDSDQAQAVAALVRIYEEAGESGHAKALLQRVHSQHPDDLRSAVMIAAITYQMDGKAKEAAAQLRTLLKDPGSPEDARAEALVHLAAAERMAGNLPEAEAAAEQAVKLNGAKRPALLQLFLLDLQRGRPNQAATHFAALRDDKVLSPALLKLLEGRLLFAQAQDAAAAQALTEASQLDPRRLDALIFSAVATVRAGRREDGWQALTRAMQMDPTRLGPRPAVTIYYLQPRDTLDGAEGQLLRPGRDPDDVMSMLAEAFIRFHQRDLPTAERLFKQALEFNNANGLAHAYWSLVALERGDRPTALREGAAAVAAGRTLAITHYAYGEALAADSQLEPAKKALRQAIEITPSFLGAACRLGELEAKSNEPAAVDAARSRLVRVVGLDPTYLPAKRTLFALDR